MQIVRSNLCNHQLEIGVISTMNSYTGGKDGEGKI